MALEGFVQKPVLLARQALRDHRPVQALLQTYSSDLLSALPV